MRSQEDIDLEVREAAIAVLVGRTCDQIIGTLRAMEKTSKPESYIQDALCFLHNVEGYIEGQVQRACLAMGGHVQ
jgi:hypothetical protein